MKNYIVERFIGGSWSAHATVEIRADSADEAVQKYCQEYLVGTVRLAYEGARIRIQDENYILFCGYPEETGYLRPIGEDSVASELLKAQMKEWLRLLDRGLD